MSPSKLQRPAPPYLQITQHYRNLIKSGQLRHGDRLPSVRQLVEEWGVTHATAAKVLTTLYAGGLVKSVSDGGGGTAVNLNGVEPDPRRDIGPYPSSEAATAQFDAVAFGTPEAQGDRHFVCGLVLAEALLMGYVTTSEFEDQVRVRLADLLTPEDIQVINGWIVRAHLAGRVFKEA
jgi:DNA-binding transcriptional MocR family regulator